MNYRHAYHAGNFADVFKHAILTLALLHLRQKEKPFFVLDTHAGTGLYDLAAAQALKTGEAAAGFSRLWQRDDIPETLAPYVEIVAGMNRNLKNAPGGMNVYPGSPAITQSLLRDTDRFVANELHPEDHETLRRLLSRDARIQVTREDGYQLLKSKLPPAERRGLVLVDPPFEVRDEFALMAKGVAQACRRFATGIYLLWYPIKAQEPVDAFHAAVKDAGLSRVLAANFYLRRPEAPDMLNGCGLVIVNPPWKLADEIGAFAPWLAGVLAPGHGYAVIRELAKE